MAEEERSQEARTRRLSHVAVGGKRRRSVVDVVNLDSGVLKGPGVSLGEVVDDEAGEGKGRLSSLVSPSEERPAKKPKVYQTPLENRRTRASTPARTFDNNASAKPVKHQSTDSEEGDGDGAATTELSSARSPPRRRSTRLAVRKNINGRPTRERLHVSSAVAQLKSPQRDADEPALGNTNAL